MCLNQPRPNAVTQFDQSGNNYVIQDPKETPHTHNDQEALTFFQSPTASAEANHKYGCPHPNDGVGGPL